MMMNRVLKNKFFRENLILLVIFQLIFPTYIFSDVWVADKGNGQVARLYREGHVGTGITVATVIDGDTISVNANPTALLYPGLKVSFGKDRENVYEIKEIVYDDTNSIWKVDFTTSSPSLTGRVSGDSPIYRELARAGGFSSPVSVSANINNSRCWIADDSTGDSSVTKLAESGRLDLPDTGTVEPYGKTTFGISDTQFELFTISGNIHPGIKIDLNRDNRSGSGYVLEVVDVDTTTSPYTLTASQGLVNDHSIIGKGSAFIHTDMVRSPSYSSPTCVSVNSISNNNDEEYGVVWLTEDTPDTDYVVKLDREGYLTTGLTLSANAATGVNRVTVRTDPTTLLHPGLGIVFGNGMYKDVRYLYIIQRFDTVGADSRIILDRGLEKALKKGDGIHKELVRIAGFSSPKSISVNSTNSGTHYGEVWVADTSDSAVVKLERNGYKTISATVAQDHSIGDTQIVLTPDTSELDTGIKVSFSNDTRYTYLIDSIKTDTEIVLSAPGLLHDVSSGDTVARELARITGFVNPIAVSVNSDARSGDCWVADDGPDTASGDTVIWLDGSISGSYDIRTDTGLHRVIKGFDKPVSVSADPVTWDCWVACEGEGVDSDSYIVKLERDVPDGYDINNPLGGYKHIRIYGFDSPRAVSVNPENSQVWVADTGNNQVVKLSALGHAVSDYTVVAPPLGYSAGDTEIGLSPSGVGSDTALFIPLKISFGNNPNEITQVYEIERTESDTIILKTGLESTLTTGTRLYQELVRVGGFDQPVDVSTFQGEDFGDTGVTHPWMLQVRELYVVDGNRTVGGWHTLPYITPIHDATPQFRWVYVDPSNGEVALDSFIIRIKAKNNAGGYGTAWSSTTIFAPDGAILPGDWIYTDWISSGGTSLNDSRSPYNSNPDEDDDCADLSQSSAVQQSGDRTYYIELTVENEDGEDTTYGQGEEERELSTFILDKTPPGSYKVCGTGVHVEETSAYNIKENKGDPVASYLQTNNYYWDAVEVRADTYPLEWIEITRNDSPWLNTKQVSVRVKVKDRNNENNETPNHPGHDTNEADEPGSNCSGISAYSGSAQYRYKSTSMSDWSSWKNCGALEVVDTGQKATGGEKDSFVWLYANNILLDNGDSNLIQFRIKDKSELEVKEVDNNDTEGFVSPNIGYSHADTAIINGHIYQVASEIFGYPIKIDSEKPEVILLHYPPNPSRKRVASFVWVAIDDNECDTFLWRLERGEWKKVSGEWQWESDGPPWVWEQGWSNLGSQYGQTSYGTSQLEAGKTYRFYIKAKDITNKVSSEVTWSWKVLYELPDTIITEGPSGEIHSTSGVIFRWEGRGGQTPYTYEFRVNGGGWFIDSDGQILVESLPGGVVEGTYIFEARVIDSNNNVDSTPARRIFTLVKSSPYSPVSPLKLYKYFREMTE